jgi:tetratricopeptide (TPR) repeat protein
MSLNPSLAPDRSRRRLRLVVVLLLLAVGVAAAWHFTRSPARAAQPPFPEGIQEVEIVQFLEQQRAEVLAHPQSGDAWGDYGLALLAHLFDREAKFCFTEAARLAPEDPRWPYGLAQIALKRDPPNAVLLLRQVLATTGPGEEYRSVARLTLAETLLERGEINEAEALFRTEFDSFSPDPRAVFGLGLVAMARNDASTAIPLLSQLRDNKHARKQVRSYLARLARERGDESGAHTLETEAAALPDDPVWRDPLLDHVARLAVGRRGRDRLIGELERAGRYQEALQVFLAQLAEERSTKSLLGAGANYLRLRQYQDAMPLMREAVEREPNSPHAQYSLALACFIPAERDIVQHPDAPENKRLLREAIVHAKRATELKPDHARAYLHWGLALNYLGEPKNAIEPLRKGLVARPDDFDLHFALGSALAACGDKTAALAEFQNASRLDPNDSHPAIEIEKLRASK